MDYSLLNVTSFLYSSLYAGHYICFPSFTSVLLRLRSTEGSALHGKPPSLFLWAAFFGKWWTFSISGHSLHLATLADMHSLPNWHSVSVSWVCVTALQRAGAQRMHGGGCATHIEPRGQLHRFPWKPCRVSAVRTFSASWLASIT